jgi:hypothetical protein
MLVFEKLVIEHLRSFNRELPPGRRLAERLDAVMIGPGASFDSLDTVEFLIGLEDEIAAIVGRRINISRRVERAEQETVTIADVVVCIEQLCAEIASVAVNI